MAYTGMAAFRAALAALAVEGVEATSRLGVAPTTVGAKLPCSFPRMPTVRGENISIGNVAGLRTGALEYVILAQASNLSSPAANAATACALLDALDDALRGAIATLGLDEWEARVQEERFGDNYYWAIIATVRASG